MKNKETLEEAAELYSKRSSASVFQENHKKDFINGAKWQSEKMYSEEEVYDILIHHTVELFKREAITLEDFWNKFKKK